MADKLKFLLEVQDKLRKGRSLARSHFVAVCSDLREFNGDLDSRKDDEPEPFTDDQILSINKKFKAVNAAMADFTSAFYDICEANGVDEEKLQNDPGFWKFPK